MLCDLGILAYIVPCYIMGKNAEAVGENCLICGLTQIINIIGVFARTQIRGKIREQKGIPVFRTECIVYR
jgi:hypothetical protein